MTKRDEMDFAEAVGALREHNDHGLLIKYLLEGRPLSAANKVEVGNALKKALRKLAAATAPGGGGQPDHPPPLDPNQGGPK
jgi:hypothetical protein